MESLDSILQKHLPKQTLDFVKDTLFGYISRRSSKLDLNDEARKFAENLNIELKGYSFLDSQSDCTDREKNDLSSSKIVRVGIFQNFTSEATSEPVLKQKESLLDLGKKVLYLASKCGVQIFCFQELWNMPWGFCTQKKLPWTEFAEDAFTGQTTLLLKKLAKEYGMVIVSSILERDKNDFLWNTCVVIDADGKVLGISRKNHIPISGKFSETSYYKPSTLRVPAFQTKFARIGLTICYDRHQAQNWFAHRLNKTQIVFNPTATVQTFSEPFWGVEARCAAIHNGYFVCANNRVGTEYFKVNDSIEEVAGPFFGSSYITAPNGIRTPGLSLDKNGLLIADLDLNTCQNFQENLKDLSYMTEEFRKYP